LALFNPVETEQRDAFEATELWLPPALPRSFLLLQLLPHRHESGSMLALPRQRFG
jgi:hypothetical protein